MPWWAINSESWPAIHIYPSRLILLNKAHHFLQPLLCPLNPNNYACGLLCLVTCLARASSYWYGIIIVAWGFWKSLSGGTTSRYINQQAHYCGQGNCLTTQPNPIPTRLLWRAISVCPIDRWIGEVHSANIVDFTGTAMTRLYTQR